jgi:hypothetical protein
MNVQHDEAAQDVEEIDRAGGAREEPAEGLVVKVLFEAKDAVVGVLQYHKDRGDAATGLKGIQHRNFVLRSAPASCVHAAAPRAPNKAI